MRHKPLHGAALVFLGERMGVSEQDIARIQEQIKTLFNEMGELKADVKELKEQLVNRLPPWATFAIASLTAAVGWFAGR